MAFKKLSELTESLETAHKLKFVEKDTDEFFNFVKKNNYDLYSEQTTDELKNKVKTYDKLQKYIISYKGENIGVIALGRAYDLFGCAVGKHTLYVTDFEINQKIKRNFTGFSPLEFPQSILDWIIEYCKENNYHHIIASARNERVYKLYICRL